MNAQTPAPRQELIARFIATGVDEGTVSSIVESMTDAQVEETLASLSMKDAEAAATRKALDASPALATAVLPAQDWKTEEDRMDVAQRALRLLEAVAARHGLTTTALAEELARQSGTVADTIALHGDDPRLAQWGSTFYAFRYRLKDAVEVLTADDTARKAAEKRATEDAAWERQGLVRCDRCDGQGGHNSWPGWTCFKCDGQRTIPAK